MADWGKTDSPYDLNADGIVDVRDLLQLLTQLANGSRGASAGGPGEVEGQHRDPGLRALADRMMQRAQRGAYHRAAAENIARSMLPYMSNSDPDEVRRSVRESNLPDPQKHAVLNRLAAWHPNGHNVSLVG